ncbi:MAG: amidohydrolase [Fodinibius sp.]|nr:amidohydrolase [Fodinibius sp.]
MDYEKLQEKANNYFDEMVAHRRHLHRNPELSFEEHETTTYIIEQLKALDISVDRPLDTGCVGVLEGGKSSDRVVALRADIDALPMAEEGDHKKEFMSQNEGIAHCCGHDGHTANMLGATHILSDLRDEIEGTVLIIFQPAEEKLPGGGRLLCETGYLQEKGVDVIYGLHSYPELEPGKIAVRPGPLMARPDEFKIELIGKGGHAASPHQAVDPIVMAGQVVTQLQSIVSRSVNPTEPAVVTVGKISGGSAHNVIPERVELLGTVRTFAQETADMIRDRIEGIVKGVTEASGGSYTYDFDYGYPAVINTEWATDGLIKAAGELLGDENIQLLDDPIMAGEDFAFYQQEFPGVFFFLGSGRAGIKLYLFVAPSPVQYR